jgi:hypothetical protein
VDEVFPRLAGNMAATTSGGVAEGLFGGTGFELTEAEVKEICERGGERHFGGNGFMYVYSEGDRR